MSNDFELSNYQQDILDYVKLSRGNLLIDAKAGSGKTSTLLLIADELIKSNKKCLFLSFNKSIVEELQYKKPELSDSIKTINSYLNDEDLIQILSAENLQVDGPNFEKSHKILNDTRNNSTLAMQTIIDLCNEDTIKNLIDKDKIDNYSYNLYLELMYTDNDLKELAETQKEMENISNHLNVFLDKVEAMIQLLEKNSSYWYIEDGQLYFETDALVSQYNGLYDDLNQYVKDNFSSSNNESNTNSSI